MPTNASKKLIMLSAMYENGGNTTHRLLDGHPELAVYPFESQLGTKYVVDYLSSLFPLKYRWPVFPSTADAKELYDLIIDEEGKVRSKTPQVSKFRTANFFMSDADRKTHFVRSLQGKNLSRANAIEAFFSATFSAWQNYRSSGSEKAWVGYSPIVGVDGDKIIRDFGSRGYVIHVVRNPFSAYADTKKRPVPLSLAHYLTAWTLCQQYALFFAAKHPKQFHIVRYEDIIADSVHTLSEILRRMDILSSPTLAFPSWNGEKLKEVYPWGTIKAPMPAVNLKTAKELTKAETREIYHRSKLYIETLDYATFYKKLVN